MAYGTAVKLESRFIATPVRFNETSNPTKAQVEEWIDETSAWIDAQIAQWGTYAVPVTGAQSVKFLTDLVMTVVACDKVWPVVARGKENPFIEAKRTQLKWFNDGRAFLPDASSASGDATLSVTHNFPTYSGPKVGDIP